MLEHSRHIVVVGAGMGGLAAAIDLCGLGYRVTVVDAADAVGGKARSVLVDGQPIDAGPTVMTMRWVFDHLLSRVGAQFDDHVELRPLDVLARHRWVDGSSLDLYADFERSVAAIAEFAGKTEADAYRRFLVYAQQIHDTVKGPFIEGQKPTLWSILREHGLGALPMALRIDGFRSMWRALGAYFSDHRLQQLFGRYATYAGNSPFQAPATFNLIAHVEAAGVWRPVGGMRAVASALGKILTGMGAELLLKTKVAEILTTAGRASGVRLANGEVLSADAVVFGGDQAALAHGHLGEAAQAAVRPVKAQGRSLSAVTWCIHGQVDGWPLAHHNVVFGDDYAEEFDAIFRRRALPKTPTVYVCAQDVGDGVQQQRDSQRLLVLVNAPADGDGLQTRGGQTQLSEEDVQSCERRTFEHLRRCGLTLQHQPHEVLRTDPGQWERLFPASGGGLYGQADHAMTASLKRMGARTRLKGLYLCGGTVHPGAGVPMAALSGMMASAQLHADQPSIALSLPAVMHGGTATSSVTTAPAI